MGSVSEPQNQHKQQTSPLQQKYEDTDWNNEGKK